MSNKILTHEGKTHIVWLDQINKIYVRSFNHKTKKWNAPVFVDKGDSAHSGASFSIDSEGYLHLVYGPLNNLIQHIVSKASNVTKKWISQTPLQGTKATYPSLVIDSEDNLHVCYQGFLPEESSRGLLYQRRSKKGEWSEPICLVSAEEKPVSVKLDNTLHLGKEGTLFLAYHIGLSSEGDFPKTNIQEIGLMCSWDGGYSWGTMEGKSLVLPATIGSATIQKFDQEQDVRLGNLSCDAHENPYFTINCLEGGIKQTFLYRRRKEKWETQNLLLEVEKLCGLCEMPDVCSLNISDSGVLFTAAVVYKRGGGRIGPTNDIVLLTSWDLGDTFSVYKISPEEPGVSNLLPILEGQTGHNQVNVPCLLYTCGEKGTDYSKELETEIRMVSLVELIKKEKRTMEDAISGLEWLSGLNFTKAQRNKIGRDVGILRARYRNLRDVSVGYDVEPPLAFLPGILSVSGREQIKSNSKPSDLVSLPGSEDELAFLPVSDLSRLVEQKKVSPVELTRIYLDRLSHYGPKLNCVVTLTEDLALAQAAKAETEIVKGDYLGPLHGIPWGAKDLLATRGIRTTWGATLFRDQVINVDATVVERLREAGAVLVAKLSLGSLAMGPHWFEGMTRNPWNVDGPSSGSSAGPGAATSAGLVGFSIGSETHGSIVSPSHICGVVGLRPSYGRISRYGAMALAWTMDKMGPMCRGVDDCATVLTEIYGPDGRDGSVADVPFTWEREIELEELKIGYIESEFELLDSASRLVYDKALEVIRSLGGIPEPMALPDYPTDAIAMILSVEAATVFDEVTRSGGIDVIKDHDESRWPDIFRAARTVPAVEYLRAQQVRTLLMRDMEVLMAEWDLIIVPGTGKKSLTATNLTGYPVVILPCGFVEGMPVGLTFIGRLYEERIPLAVSRLYEQATEWHLMHPNLDAIDG